LVTAPKGELLVWGRALGSYVIDAVSPFGPVCELGARKLVQFIVLVNEFVVIADGAAQFVFALIVGVVVTPFTVTLVGFPPISKF